MSRYDVTTHPRLSPEARSLDSAPGGALDDYAKQAEDQLGYRVAALLTGEAAELARRAIVLQINHIVERGTNAAVYASFTDGIQSRTLADALLCPESVAIAQGQGVFPTPLIAVPAKTPWPFIPGQR